MPLDQAISACGRDTDIDIKRHCFGCRVSEPACTERLFASREAHAAIMHLVEDITGFGSECIQLAVQIWQHFIPNFQKAFQLAVADVRLDGLSVDADGLERRSNLAR